MDVRDPIPPAELSRRADELGARLTDTAKLYHTVFASEHGRKVLADLERIYDGSTLARDVNATVILSARRDVLLRIRALLEIAREGEADLDPNTMTYLLDGVT